MDMRETIGEFEFSTVPREFFAADGMMLYCSNKSVLSHCVVDNSSIPDPVLPSNMVKDGKSVIIVDAMAEVQCLEKDNTVENCGDLAKVFVQKLFGKFTQMRHFVRSF